MPCIWCLETLDCLWRFHWVCTDIADLDTQIKLAKVRWEYFLLESEFQRCCLTSQKFTQVTPSNKSGKADSVYMGTSKLRCLGNFPSSQSGCMFWPHPKLMSGQVLSPTVCPPGPGFNWRKTFVTQETLSYGVLWLIAWQGLWGTADVLWHQPQLLGLQPHRKLKKLSTQEAHKGFWWCNHFCSLIL